jgi:tRNA nucleotidyltransferase (CCA-adding enzyme)
MKARTLPELFCRALAKAAMLRGGNAILVGGAVRDLLMGTPPKDLDVELFGIPEAEVETFLQALGCNVNRVGRAFPVWKVWNDDIGHGNAIDITLPRLESKSGVGHTDFDITLDPFMSFEQAAFRRDFTINAMGLDLFAGGFIDPYGGRDDLKNGVLRHVSAHFDEDPLRVLRGMQFCARFQLEAAPDTIMRCRTLTPEHISKERLWEEWTKLILKGVRPSKGLTFLRAAGWAKYFPELNALWGIPQAPDHHPEGDVWTHTLHCMDAFAQTRIGDDFEDLIVGFATLCHDLGKVDTTTLGQDGKWRAYGHEEAGEAPTRAFLGRMTDQKDLINDVVSLVVTHMRPTFLWKEANRGGELKAMNRSVRRLARVVRLDRLARVVWNDKAGRPPKPQVSPESEWLRARAAELEVSANKPKPLLTGKHLIEMGLAPGLQFKMILNGALEKQLDGDISTVEQALAYARDSSNL